ncbi:unnamed protein product [Linum tenue]|uniref:Uncharacterized protein n=1 Tax=Linum tenue TaxID=586396 RepID=A0AAV0RQS2_9ROSI|nr:unnamed protein product [Linum tenue]
MALFPPSPSFIFSQHDSSKEDDYGKIHLFSRLPSPSSTSFVDSASSQFCSTKAKREGGDIDDGGSQGSGDHMGRHSRVLAVGDGREFKVRRRGSGGARNRVVVGNMAKIQTRRLSPGTTYAAYLVFKLMGGPWTHRVRGATRESQGRVCG